MEYNFSLQLLTICQDQLMICNLYIEWQNH